MKEPAYLVRFDDVCSTMDWESWNKVEKVLVAEGIKPIMAVVPENRDAKLIVGEDDKYFWSKVIGWQKMGWSIAVHGYQHLYQTNDPGLLGLNKYSEFAGLSYEQQKKKLIKAINIFNAHGVKPDLWVAPGHSFDNTTLRVLTNIDIDVISDGFYKRPVKHMNKIWIPQQLWRFRSFRSGIWTVCFHINGMKKSELERTCSDFIKYSKSIVSLDHLLKNTSVDSLSTFDQVFSFVWKGLIKLKRLVSKLKS